LYYRCKSIAGDIKWQCKSPSPAGPSVLAKERRGVMRGNREQITVTLPPETLNRLEVLARGAGMTRAAVLNLGIYRLLENEL
jgi:hypothetical protein